MDNVTHTLVGAALAEAGLRRRTPLAAAALVIGANLPDVDGLAYLLLGPDEALGFRRGWTHGVPAMVAWPFALALGLLAWDRWVRRRRDPAAEPAKALALLGLSALAVLTHSPLDFLNTYGVRFLMPLRDVWHYGDTLFIADPWIWLALGAGYLAARRRRRGGRPRPARPATLALALSAAYMALMAGGALASRSIVRREMETRGIAVDRLMVGPLPLTPFRRQVVAASGPSYVRGTVDLLRSPAYRDGDPAAIDANAGAPEATAASRTRAGAVFLHWARFPVFVVPRGGRGDWVAIVDARYTLDPGAGFGALSVPLPEAIPSGVVSPNQERVP